MVDFQQLPEEVAIQVFQHLYPSECTSLINDIKGPLSAEPVVQTLVLRLYGSRVVMLGVDSSIVMCNDLETIVKLEWLTDEFDSSRLFAQIAPQNLEFRFWRGFDGYTSFIEALYQLSWFLKTERKPSPEDEAGLQYVLNARTYSFTVDAHLVMVENPAVILLMTIKLLCQLSLEQYRHKVISIKITLTEIGTYCGEDFLGLLARFENLEVLEIVASEVLLNEARLRLPNKLKVLRLDRNSVPVISPRFINKLPPTLEVLLLRNCRIKEFAPPSQALATGLPNLRKVILSENIEMCGLRAEYFEGMKECVVDVRNCPCIESSELARLKKQVRVRI